jgi:hypothetical protein
LFHQRDGIDPRTSVAPVLLDAVKIDLSTILINLGAERHEDKTEWFHPGTRVTNAVILRIACGRILTATGLGLQFQYAR